MILVKGPREKRKVRDGAVIIVEPRSRPWRLIEGKTTALFCNIGTHLWVSEELHNNNRNGGGSSLNSLT